MMRSSSCDCQEKKLRDKFVDNLTSQHKIDNYEINILPLFWVIQKKEYRQKIRELKKLKAFLHPRTYEILKEDQEEMED